MCKEWHVPAVLVVTAVVVGTAAVGQHVEKMDPATLMARTEEM